MADLKDIKEKMQIFLNEFKNVNTPDEAIERFKQIFDNEYYETFTNDEEPYYESHTQRIYLKNGYGIGIQKTWGPFDFTGGGLVSHEGEDLDIFSMLAKRGIALFECSEKIEVLDDIDYLYDIDLSVQNLISVDDDLIFDVIPKNELEIIDKYYDDLKRKDKNELENIDKMFNSKYEDLKREAIIKHDNDANNNLISYYGGLDVIIHSTEYYLYNSLMEHIKDKNFMEKVIPLFVADFPDYLDNRIEECNQVLYIIDKKDKYYKLIELEEIEAEYEKEELYYMDCIKSVENKQEELQLNLNDSLNELYEVKNKKYNIIDFFKGAKKKDIIKLNSIQQNVFSLKADLYIQEETLKMNKSQYELLQNKMKMAQEQKLKLKEELIYQLSDLTLFFNFEDEKYIESEYDFKVSLDRLITKKHFYFQKLEDLLYLKKNYVKSKDLTIENQKQDIDINYDY